jgi:hypothetical protein
MTINNLNNLIPNNHKSFMNMMMDIFHFLYLKNEWKIKLIHWIVMENDGWIYQLKLMMMMMNELHPWTIGYASWTILWNAV